MGGEEKFPTILLLKQDRCERDRDIEIKFGANSSGDPLQQLRTFLEKSLYFAVQNWSRAFERMSFHLY